MNLNFHCVNSKPVKNSHTINEYIKLFLPIRGDYLLQSKDFTNELTNSE